MGMIVFSNHLVLIVSCLLYLSTKKMGAKREK